MSNGSQTEPANVSRRASPSTFLPTSALMAFIPMVAALVLIAREGGAHGAKEFLSRALDYRSIKSGAWVVTALFLMPLVFALEYERLRLAGAALPGAQLFSAAKIAAFF